MFVSVVVVMVYSSRFVLLTEYNLSWLSNYILKSCFLVNLIQYTCCCFLQYMLVKKKHFKEHTCMPSYCIIKQLARIRWNFFSCVYVQGKVTILFSSRGGLVLSLKMRFQRAACDRIPNNRCLRCIRWKTTQVVDGILLVRQLFLSGHPLCFQCIDEST